MIKTLFLTAVTLLSAPAWAGFSDANSASADTLLSVDDAFRIQPLEYDGQRLRVSWEVAPGHYLYRKRLSFKLLDPAQTLPAVQLPKGVPYRDEYFGDVEIYRGATLLTADFPWSKHQPLPQRVQVKYQGCAEIGVCYPPQTRVLELPTPTP